MTNPEADKVENLEGTSRLPQTARGPETPAGSESTARADKEASRNLGDPRRSRTWNRVGRLNGPSIGRPTLSWKSDPLVVLGARESRAQGEAAEQVEELGQGHIPYAQK